MATSQVSPTDVAPDAPGAQPSSASPQIDEAEHKQTEDMIELTTPAAALVLSEDSEPPSENDAFLSNQLVFAAHTITQPQAIPDPELGIKEDPSAAVAAPVKKRRRPRFRRFKAVLFAIGQVLFQGLSLLWIGLLYGIPGVILVALGLVVFIGLPLAFAAAYGSVAMLMGNGILRAAHLAHYTNNASAAAIGAVGVTIMGPAFAFVLNAVGVRYDEEENPAPWYVRMISTVVVHTISAPVGYAVLAKHHVDLGPIDVLHATRAGALGGTILGPGSIVLMPVIGLVLGILLSPLWIAMMAGLRWCHVRSTETFDGSWHTYSSCVSYGTCGDDEEIEQEVAMARTPRYGFHTTGRGRFINDF